MAVYLIAGFLLAELSFGKCLRRLRVVLPLVCMVGLNMDYSGTIQVGEYPVSKQYLPQIRTKLGYVFQDSDSQLFMSTVYEDVAFALRNYGLTADETDQRVRQALDLTGISVLSQVIILYVMKKKNGTDEI